MLVALLEVEVFPKVVLKVEITVLILDNCSLVILGTSLSNFATTSLFPSLVLEILLFKSSISACTSNLVPTFSSSMIKLSPEAFFMVASFFSLLTSFSISATFSFITSLL
ncbi:hypothetical protein SDC9_100515 [bioreactor metagenome]|uniref:Uncharacterized protein n=1 Tax=bioreactor metagenome TaxID=1076179 RepID=A0A645ALE3_9ZZZZ